MHGSPLPYPTEPTTEVWIPWDTVLLPVSTSWKKKKIKPQLCNPRRKGQPLVGVSGRLREAHHPPTHMPPTQLQSQGPLLAWQDTMQSVSHH